jgi:hypothetical protein
MTPAEELTDRQARALIVAAEAAGFRREAQLIFWQYDESLLVPEPDLPLTEWHTTWERARRAIAALWEHDPQALPELLGDQGRIAPLPESAVTRCPSCCDDGWVTHPSPAGCERTPTAKNRRHLGGNPSTAASRTAAAEGQGFEPWVRLHAQRFSRPPRSTTPAPLRGRGKRPPERAPSGTEMIARSAQADTAVDQRPAVVAGAQRVVAGGDLAVAGAQDDPVGLRADPRRLRARDDSRRVAELDDDVVVRRP